MRRPSAFFGKMIKNSNMLLKNNQLRPKLEKQLSLVMDTCIDCPKCVAQCAFLKKYGNPRAIAAAYDPSDISRLTMPFECSLCDLCAPVCPVNLVPGAMFLEMRREAVARGVAPLSAHKRIMAYEQRGISREFSWYSLPENCHTVFFPGCTFAGTRMDTAIALYEYLKTIIPEMGIVLDCCCKPSHDLGRDEFFHEVFTEMSSWLTAYGVKTVLVACPNCHKVFKTYGSPLEVVTIYEFLAENGLPVSAETKTADHSLPPVSIHDPCVLRNEKTVLEAVRTLAAAKGFAVVEMPHAGRRTLCCGEGGAAGFVASEFASTWGDLRREEAGDRRLLTCCAGCAELLNRKTPTDHILDVIVHPEAVAAGKRKTTKTPMTYFNRIRLKRYLQKNHPAAVTRERDFSPISGKTGSRGGNITKIMSLIIDILLIVAVSLIPVLIRKFKPKQADDLEIT